MVERGVRIVVGGTALSQPEIPRPCTDLQILTLPFIARPGKQEVAYVPNAGTYVSMEASRKTRVYEILESRVFEHPAGKAIAAALSLLIFFNVIAAVLETDTAIFAEYGHLLDTFAVFSVMVFTVEYILRVWCCTENPVYSHPFWGRLKYMRTPMAMIDLLVILPLIISPFLVAYPWIYAMIRFSRIFWILKIGHYSRSLKTLGRVVSAKRGEMLTAFFIMFVLLILGSALIYFAEHDAQPQKFSSVLASLWWGVETMATIGYGDMVPVTPMGKFIASIIALVGVGLFALPAGFLASGFIEEVNRRKEEEQGHGCQQQVSSASRTCPHCGKDLVEVPGNQQKEP
jgi:voltage-gated potassium channel